MFSEPCVWIIGVIIGMADVLELELETELGQFSVDSMLGGGKGDIQPGAEVAMAGSFVGTESPFTLADPLFSTLLEFLLLLRVRGRPARLAGL